jgi:hypothetical protein
MKWEALRVTDPVKRHHLTNGGGLWDHLLCVPHVGRDPPRPLRPPIPDSRLDYPVQLTTT